MSVDRSRLLERLARGAAAVASGPRPAELALVVAVGFALFLYLPLRLTFGRSSPVEGLEAGPDRLPPVRLAEVDPNGQLFLPTPPFHAPESDERRNVRNPFNFQKPPTPPPTPTRPPTPTPPPPTPPPPTPTPYNSPLTLVGFVSQGERRIAFLKANEEIFVALEGDVLSVKEPDGRMRKHRVKRIGLETVEIGPVEFEASLVLRAPK